MSAMPAIHQVRIPTPIPPVEAPNLRAGEEPAFVPGRLLVASDGRSLSDGALRLAREIGARYSTAVSEVAVYEPRIPLPISTELRPTGHGETADEPAIASLEARVRGQRARVIGEASDWPIRIQVGYPAVMIDRVARREAADLVLAGLGPELPQERRFTKLTALSVAYASDIPVLAVATSAWRLPTRVLVVLGYDEASLRAARVAMALVEDGGTVHLLHVRRGAPPWTLESSWALGQLFESAERGAAKRGITVERQVIDGDPVPAILGAAERRGIELIAAPLHGCTFAQRSVMPNLAAPLMRAASCSVLVVPCEGTNDR